MRRLIYVSAALILLAVSSGVSDAADLGATITTTDGCRYTKAVDGNYYPSIYVRADGSIGTPPLAAAPTSGCICGDNCTCAAGMCPAKCPVAAAQPAMLPQFAYPALAPPQYQFAAPPTCSSCPGGSCGVPQQRGVFFRRR